MCWTIEQLPKNSTNKYEIFKLWFETDNIDMPLNELRSKTEQITQLISTNETIEISTTNKRRNGKIRKYEAEVWLRYDLKYIGLFKTFLSQEQSVSKIYHTMLTYFLLVLSLLLLLLSSLLLFLLQLKLLS